MPAVGNNTTFEQGGAVTGPPNEWRRSRILAGSRVVRFRYASISLLDGHMRSRSRGLSSVAADHNILWVGFIQLRDGSQMGGLGDIFRFQIIPTTTNPNIWLSWRVSIPHVVSGRM